MRAGIGAPRGEAPPADLDADVPVLPRLCVCSHWVPRSGSSTTFLWERKELVLFRTEAGVAGILDAHCPHLGANMAYGGCVVGETLRCPFHGFRFDKHGACVASGYGLRPPPKAHARTWPIRERNGFILVYHHPNGEAPEWEVPDLDTKGWSPVLCHRFDVRGHPQETSENSVDMGHFSEVHGYRSVAMIGEARVDGPHLGVTYHFDRFVGLGGRFGRTVAAEFDADLFGLGYSLVSLRLPAYGLRLRQWVLSTPSRSKHVDFRIAVSLDDLILAERVKPVLGLVPHSFLSHVVGQAVLRMFKRDVAQDFDIWKNKRYLPSPALAAGDGPVGLYRKWASQFYA